MSYDYKKKKYQTVRCGHFWTRLWKIFCEVSFRRSWTSPQTKFKKLQRYLAKVSYIIEMIQTERLACFQLTLAAVLAVME